MQNLSWYKTGLVSRQFFFSLTHVRVWSRHYARVVPVAPLMRGGGVNYDSLVPIQY